MTKLDRLIERLRALPEDEQERLVAEIEFALDHPAEDFVLTEAQEAELARRLADPDREFVPHEEVFARLKARLPK